MGNAGPYTHTPSIISLPSHGTGSFGAMGVEPTQVDCGIESASEVSRFLHI
jgi:hypothetical protein